MKTIIARVLNSLLFNYAYAVFMGILTLTSVVMLLEGRGTVYLLVIYFSVKEFFHTLSTIQFIILYKNFRLDLELAKKEHLDELMMKTKGGGHA